jgi:hypothetical protein
MLVHECCRAGEVTNKGFAPGMRSGNEAIEAFREQGDSDKVVGRQVRESMCQNLWMDVRG